jgi:putative acetyltransferase
LRFIPDTISSEYPDGGDARSLMAGLDAHLIPLYPPVSHHGYSVEKLLAEKADFFVLRVDGAAAGCGALKCCGENAEIKRMYVRPQFRGRGLGRAIIDRLERYAGFRGESIVRLETGILQREAMGCMKRRVTGKSALSENIRLIRCRASAKSGFRSHPSRPVLPFPPSRRCARRRIRRAGGEAGTTNARYAEHAVSMVR